MADDIKTLNFQAEELVKAGVSRNGLARQLRMSNRAASQIMKDLGVVNPPQLQSCMYDEAWMRRISIHATPGLLHGIKLEQEAADAERAAPVETEAAA